MQFAVKLFISLIIISVAQYISQSRPSLAGLIAVMPLTGLIVMLWVWHDSSADVTKMGQYTLGAVLGIIPSLFFFIVAYFCFRAKMRLSVVLGLSVAVWIMAAVVHQHFLRH